MSTWNEIHELVIKAQAGDGDAYGELFVRFKGVVFATALKHVKDPTAAEELTQDVFIHGLRKISQLRDPRCFAGWLRKITGRMALNRLTKRGLITGGEPDLFDQIADREVSNPIDSIEREENKAKLQKGLQQLKPMDRKTLEAFYIEEKSLKEIAENTGAPLGTIKRRLHVARLRLKEAMEE